MIQNIIHISLNSQVRINPENLEYDHCSGQNLHLLCDLCSNTLQSGIKATIAWHNLTIGQCVRLLIMPENTSRLLEADDSDVMMPNTSPHRPFMLGITQRI